MRVAYLPDSFHEINGVAHTSRNFQAFAERHKLPFLCIRAALPGERRQVVHEQLDSLETLELARSTMAIQLEKDLCFDPLFWRHAAVVEQTIRDFRPDILHITGPSELGILGAYLAWKLKLPLAASWHTNVHEYAARRMNWLTRHLGAAGPTLEDSIEHGSLNATARFYRLARVLYAPNAELCSLLEETTHRPCHRMPRGVETDLFTPARRTRPPEDRSIVLGYVGRLSIEKNVALLPRLDAELRARGLRPKWLIIGQGAEEASLRAALPEAEFTGVLRSEPLAAAYANMDLFIFPSHTDTFGNVVLEALASGVPAIVTPDGGPKFIVQEGETGFVRPDTGFADAITTLATNPELLATMRTNARNYAQHCSWDAVFERVIAAYPIEATV